MAGSQTLAVNGGTCSPQLVPECCKCMVLVQERLSAAASNKDVLPSCHVGSSSSSQASLRL
jgi:hypothetical protein